MDDKNLSNLINSLSPDDIQSLQSVAQSLFGGQNQGGQQAGPTQQNTPLPTAGQNGAAEALGALIYFFEFACGVSGYMEGVNPFNQPGVEAYKKNMFHLLGKPGY